MRLPSLLLLLAVTLVLGACPSASSKDEAADIPCICGTEDGDVLGCHNPVCATGQRNPDNPDCICGPITADEEDA